ncbi:orexin receptor type 2 [Elysia marginata]|uniref:Thyrotropin-releasing hormone receptor n=1 Tax=Elysia marginata TaxID=1093978 RepID=A0AAV4EWP5_9GAST|nr:orexin receptor type 2 [Elysia marginata]
MLLFYDVHWVDLKSGGEHFCLHETKYNLFINVYIGADFVLWYLQPLLFMTLLYCRIGLTLRRSQLAEQTVSSRHMCPGDSMDTSLEPDTDASSSPRAARLHSSETNTVSPSARRGAPTAHWPRMFVSRVQLWWRKRKIQHLGFTPSVMKQGCCRKRGRRASLNTTGPTRETRVSADDQETTFTALPSSPDTAPGKFLFRSKRGGGGGGVRGKVMLSCLEPELSSHITSCGIQNHTASEGSFSGRRSSPSQRQCAHAHAHSTLISRRTNAIPRCRLTTQYRSRRRAIRLLVVVVGAFAVLLLPIHAKQLLHLIIASDKSLNNSVFMTFFGYLCLYMNSAINPILYTFVSQTFRRHMREAFCSRRSTTSPCRRSRRSPRPEVS